MDSVRIPLVREKLVVLQSHLLELQSTVPSSVTDYLAQRTVRRAVERLAQIVVECASDINRMIAEGNAQPPPASARESFQIARTLGVIDERLLKRFHDYVNMRNFLVHDYDNLDDKLIYNDAKRLLVDGGAFIKQARAYVLKQEHKPARRRR